MAMKSKHLQAMFARQREVEHMHVERTQAVNKYYDHWGKVTSRFENWTTPEYYQQADEKLQRSKDKKEKEKQLDIRREKLAQLLDQEKVQYEMELKQKQSSRRSQNLNTKTLEKINDNLKEEQNIRRKLELEAKLYGKWRHGVDNDQLIFESKSDNEVIAKLNWLDKQVEKQLEREKDEIAAKDRDLRLQAELNRTEELHKQRQEIREHEIREIRALQEKHMEQLQLRQKENDNLKEHEQKLRDHLDELDKELELLTESYLELQQPHEFDGNFNLTKIKVFIRKRSEVFRNQIKLCISMLDRILAYAERSESWLNFKQQLSKQLDSEMYVLSQIDAMYESEAKYNLHRCEDLWQSQHTERYKDLKELMESERISKAKLLNDVIGNQHELIDIRATHLNAIESTSEKLKQLINEAEDSPRACNFQHNEEESNKSLKCLNIPCLEIPPPLPQSSRTLNNYRHNSPQNEMSSTTYNPAENAARFSANRDEDHVASSFHNLNLDTMQSVPSSPRELDDQRLNAQRTFQVVTAQNAERPKFGRKRVAWN